MIQKTLTEIILLVLTVALFTGCDKEPPKPQSVVINILEIAEAMGFNEQIKERAKTINQQIIEEIKVLSDELKKEFEEEKASFGDTPSKEDEKKIKTLREQMGKQIIEARNAGNSRRTEEVSEIRQSFLDEIMTVAQEVALEHGASIILKAMGVLWSEGAVEITDEVVGRMSAGKDTPTEDSGQKLEEQDTL